MGSTGLAAVCRALQAALTQPSGPVKHSCNILKLAGGTCGGCAGRSHQVSAASNTSARTVEHHNRPLRRIVQVLRHAIEVQAHSLRVKVPARRTGGKSLDRGEGHMLGSLSLSTKPGECICLVTDSLSIEPSRGHCLSCAAQEGLWTLLSGTLPYGGPRCSPDSSR